MMRGVYNVRPPQPRYVTTWKVTDVLLKLQTWDNSQLCLYDLSLKLVLLLALAKAPRAKELCLLSYRAMQERPDGISFRLTAPTKTQRGGAMKEFFVPVFVSSSSLCPVACLHAYLQKTAVFRTPSDKGVLLISSQKPHDPVAVSTVSRWIKSGLAKCGIDVSKFSGHSTRGVAATAAREAGVSMEVVLASADWSTPHTFISHYFRPHALSSFGNAVLQNSSS